MSETKHTPGPWDYDCDSGGCYFKLSAGEEAIIDCCDFCSTPTINTEANARLIAAAPELLEALELAERKFVRLHISLSLNEKAGRRSADKDPDVQEIRAAIAKAKATMNP